MSSFNHVWRTHSSIQALADAGKLDWGAHKQSADEERWERFFHHVLLFCNVHHHCNVPQRYEIFVDPTAPVAPPLALPQSPSSSSSAHGTDDENDPGGEGEDNEDEQVAVIEVVENDVSATTTTVDATNTSTTTAANAPTSSAATECLKLGKWLEKQRRAMRQGELRADRAQKIQDLMDRGAHNNTTTNTDLIVSTVIVRFPRLDGDE